MEKIKDRKSTKLQDKKTVVTEAVFWKIPHDTSPDEIHLKLGRYKKVGPAPLFGLEPERGKPKSELTLNGEEFQNLIKFIQDNYEAFKDGAKAYLPLDNPYDISVAQQIKQLLSANNNKKTIQFLMENEVIPEELEIGLVHARRAKAIDKFNEMLRSNLIENTWQSWFEKNSWVLGSDFVKVLDERAIDTEHIADFLLESYDGFLDIVEIKRPEGNLQFWHPKEDHGNYIPHIHLIKAITQSLNYLFEIEREANSVKFLERVGNVKTIKPRSTLIFGRSNDWNKKQQESFRILNSSYHNLTIMTFDHVLERGNRILGRTS